MNSHGPDKGRGESGTDGNVDDSQKEIAENGTDGGHLMPWWAWFLIGFASAGLIGVVWFVWFACDMFRNF